MLRRRNLRLETLEVRDQPSVAAPPSVASLSGSVLTVTGNEFDNRIEIFRDVTDVVVRDNGNEIGRFAVVAVNSISVNALGGDDTVLISRKLLIPATIVGGTGRNKLSGGGGTNVLIGGSSADVLKGGTGSNTFIGNGGRDNLFKVGLLDTITASPGSRALREDALPIPFGSLGQPQELMTASDVDALLKRAAAASSTTDAIIVIVDRNGRILGVRVESGVPAEIQNDPAKLVFAIDGAVAKARTGAFFGNNEAPLTSRTIQFISQSTITQREVDSNPNDTNPNSTVRGPGFVAAVGTKGHFPPGIAFTPQVDLFGIEHTNRDGTSGPGLDRIKGTADDVKFNQRFNLESAFVPTGQELFAPDSYGVESGLLPGAQSRGIATLPGGIPLYKNGQIVGGIGVFFPGKTGYATEENSSLSSTFDVTKPDRSLEAEFIAFAAGGGLQGLVPVGALGGVELPPGFKGIPVIGTSRIDLVGIQLDVLGPGGLDNGMKVLQQVGVAVKAGTGNPNDGKNQVIVAAGGVTLRDGVRAAEGWLVTPHDGDGITASDVELIINSGIEQAFDTRAAIRLPVGQRTRMVFAVADKTGKIVGLYRMPDATIFSIDVAVAKARNVAYYANADDLQPIDRVDDVPLGTAFTNRSFRYLAEPRFPIGIDGTPPAPFSQLLDGGADPLTGLQVGARLPASAYQSVYGYDAFNPGTNFRDKTDINNANGIVFFPGSASLYKNGKLVGGFGVSGDGVDQDDIVTGAGQVRYGVPLSIPRVDQLFIRGVRVPYQKTNRNPEG